jgi:hypothetical protein
MNTPYGSTFKTPVELHWPSMDNDFTSDFSLAALSLISISHDERHKAGTSVDSNNDQNLVLSSVNINLATELCVPDSSFEAWVLPFSRSDGTSHFLHPLWYVPLSSTVTVIH